LPPMVFIPLSNGNSQALLLHTLMAITKSSIKVSL